MLLPTAKTTTKQQQQNKNNPGKKGKEEEDGEKQGNRHFQQGLGVDLLTLVPVRILENGEQRE